MDVLDVDENDHGEMEFMYFRRRFMLPRQCQTNGFERLEVTDTRDDMMWLLYDIYGTPAKGLAELGVGFGLFFSVKIKLAVVSFIIVLVTIPNWFTTGHMSGSSYLLACDQTTPVCLDEGCKLVGNLEHCEHLTQGFASLDILVVLIFCLFMIIERVTRPGLARKLISATQPGAVASDLGDMHGEGYGGSHGGGGHGSNHSGSASFDTEDEAKVGVEHYAVWVTNPPPDLVNPDLWRDYFEKHFGEIVYVSVAKPNRPFLELLMQRRRLLQALLLSGSSCATRVGMLPDDPEGFGLDEEGSDDEESTMKGTGRMARRSHEVRGSRAWITSEGLRIERDAPWLTGGHSAQAAVLSAQELQERRWRISQHTSMVGELCAGHFHKLAELVWGGDLVEDNEYAGLKAEEQEVLLHDINDLLAAVVATRCRQQQVVQVSKGVGRRASQRLSSKGGHGVAGSNDVYGMATSPDVNGKNKNVPHEQSVDAGVEAGGSGGAASSHAAKAERAASVASSSRVARYLSSPTASGAAAVVVVFNTARDASTAIATLEPKPGYAWRWCLRFWREFAAVVFLGHSNGGTGTELNEEDEQDPNLKPFEMRPGYVPQVMKETPAPERVRWGSIGGGAFFAMGKSDGATLRSSHDISALYQVGKARVLSVAATIGLWWASYMVCWFLVSLGDHYGLAACWVLFANHKVGPVLHGLTDKELHIDEAAHQTWYFHKLALFRVGNCVLSLLYATMRHERYGRAHLGAIKILLLLHALVPPIIKAIDAKYRWRRFLGIKSAMHGKAKTEVFDDTNTRLFDDQHRRAQRVSGSSTGTESKYPSHLLRSADDADGQGDEAAPHGGAFAAVESVDAGEAENIAATKEATDRAHIAVPLRRKAAMMGREPDLADNYSHLVTTVCLGLGYAAFVAPTPLLMLVGIIISYYSDKYALLRAASCGWVRGSHSHAQVRMAGAAAHWFGVAVILHFTITAAGFYRWPHSDLCPKITGEGAQVYVDPVAQPQQIRHKIFLAEVYGHCRGNDSGVLFLLFPILPNVFPQSSSATASSVLVFYSSIAFCFSFVVVSLILWWPRPGRSCCAGKGRAKTMDGDAAQHNERISFRAHLSENGPVDVDDLPEYRDLGARTSAYIPCTARAHSGLQHPTDIRAWQPPGTKPVTKSTIETLGNFMHFPLIACEPGRGKFVPAHLPWRHKTFWKDLEEMRAATESFYDAAKQGLGNGITPRQEVLDAKSLAHRLVAFGREDFPHLSAATVLISPQGSSAATATAPRLGVKVVDEVLRTSRLFSTIKYYGDWQGDEVPDVEEIHTINPEGLVQPEMEEEEEEEQVDEEAAAWVAEEEVERLRLVAEEEERELREQEEAAEQVRQVEIQRKKEEEKVRKAAAKKKKEEERAKRKAEELAAAEAEEARLLAKAEALALKAQQETERKKTEKKSREEERLHKEEEERFEREAKELKLDADRQERLEAKRLRREARAKRRADREALEARQPHHTAVNRDLGGTMSSWNLTHQRLEELKAMAKKRRALTPKEEAELELHSDLVFMWGIEDGDVFTGEVKPWPCTVTHASTVKLSMPEPEGKVFATNERAWGLVFSSFLNTPGTPYRSKLLRTAEGKLTPGTGYMAAALDARVIKISHGIGPNGDEDSPDCILDVVYESDTHGKRPAAGDANAMHMLTELEVPRARVQSREPAGDVFEGAAVKVTKIVQRTFEFVSGMAASEAMAAMIRNTPGTAAHIHASSPGAADAAAAEAGEVPTFTSSGRQGSIQAMAPPDPRFGLEHGGCLFEVSRPLKVELHGLSYDHGEATLPNAESIRIAEKGDSVPPEQPFPKTSRWGGNEDPETQKVWDVKTLSTDGMPLRFVNNRRHCAIVYKVFRFEDIDQRKPKPIKAAELVAKAKETHRLSVRMRAISITDDDGALTGAKEEAAEFTGTGPHKDDPVVVYLRPGETGWVRAPPGVFHLRLAEGRKWFGPKFQFGPSVTGWGGSPASGGGIDEPFANYGTSKWQYSPMWLYRTRSGRWCITMDDPTVSIVEVGEGGEALSKAEQSVLRDKYMRDLGLFRQKVGTPLPISTPAARVLDEDGAELPPDEGLEWQVLKGAHDTSADAEESDDDLSSESDDDDEETKRRKRKAKNGENKRTFPWQPFPLLKLRAERDESAIFGGAAAAAPPPAAAPAAAVAANEDSGGGGTKLFPATRSPLAKRGSNSTMSATGSAANSTDGAAVAPDAASSGGNGGGEGKEPEAGAAAVAAAEEQQQQQQPASATPPGFTVSGLHMLVGGQGTFLRMVAPEEEDQQEGERSRRVSFDGGETSAKRPLLVHGAPVYKYDPRFEFLKDLYTQWKENGGKRGDVTSAREIAGDEHGRAGPKEGAWWWELRAHAKTKRSFAREMLEALGEEDGERSEFFHMWHAATFEVPEKRIRTVIWPRS